jgi:NAD(P)-dependent dehydrogenase (short-subunit alcohol dehydrogenase family)
MFDLSTSTALITGGTRGIGLAIAEDILAAGGKVVINGRSATADAERLLATHPRDRFDVIYADVADPAAATALVAGTVERLGGCNVLVHSAGGPAPGKVLDLSEDDWMSAFRIHVHPVFHLFRAAHPHLARQGGAVLLVSSVAGLRGCPGTVAYQTVKGALIPMAKALAMDHGHEGIRVNVLAPGIIRTRFHDAMTEAAKAHNIANRIPIRREGTVEDVSSLALELLRNTFVTGETFTVDGGMSMRVTG